MKSSYLLLTVFLALVASVSGQSNQGLLRWNCSQNYNRASYQFDRQLTTTNTAATRFPTSCALPNTDCTCSSTAWRVAPWEVLTANPWNNGTTIRNWYPDNRAGQAQVGPNKRPYIMGIVSRATCCAACGAGNVVNGTDGRISSYYANGTKVFNCAYWMHYVPPSVSSGTNCSTTVTSSDACGFCVIFPVGSGNPGCNNGLNCAPSATSSFSASHYATVGKGCPGGTNDPHFVGAKGTHFDFNGVPDQSFCLITDKQLQVNMKMRGYFDERTVGATVLENGKAVRTWIKDLGIMWIDASGAKHSFKMWARDGKSQSRDEGFVGGMEINGAGVGKLLVGQKAELPGGLTLDFLGYEKQGGGFFDVDVYLIQIPGLLTLEVKLRIAHPLLQTADDAMTHINVKFIKVEHSEHIHGVLGQTFREGREKRVMDYASLAHLLKRDIAADSELGKGFLDGSGSDYKTSDVLSSDCMFSAFGEQHLPSSL